jgi:hypothetical protein
MTGERHGEPSEFVEQLPPTFAREGRNRSDVTQLPTLVIQAE